jgi:hypothetical protein
MTGKVPRLEPRSSGQRTSKVVRQYWSPFFQKWITKSGNQSSGFQNANRKAAQAGFSAAVKMIKNLSADDCAAASLMARNTPFLDRDLKMKAATGLLLQWIDTDGKVWTGRRQVYPDIQAALDSITTQQGAVLVRTEAGWLGLLPGDPNQVMTMDAVGKYPLWADSQGGGGGGDGAKVITPPIASCTGTDNWPAGYYILQPIFLRAGSIINSGALFFSANDAGAKWNVGVYDGGYDALVNPLGNTPLKTGAVKDVIEMQDFAVPIVIPSDGIYYLGAYCDTTVGIYRQPTGWQRFFNDGTNNWASVSPSTAANGNGSATIFDITYPPGL